MHPPRPHPHVLSDVLFSKCPHLPWMVTKFFLEPDLEAPSYTAADIQADNLTLTRSSFWAAVLGPACVGFALTSSGALPTTLIQQSPSCLSLGLCPPVLSRNLGPSIPCPQSFCAAARLRHACPSSPTPVWTCPFLPGSCRTAVLGGSVVMYWSLSPKLSLPHSRDRAFSSFYL